MWAIDGAGGSTASTRSAAASFSGSCGASLRSTFGASGAGPSRKKQVAPLLEPLAQELRRLLRAPVLGEPPRELLGRLLGLELGELGVLLGEHRARLQLEQRRDQDEELAAGVEVELAALGEVLDERDHDLGEVDLAERQLLAQHEREQQVERPLERVEVQLELADGDRHRAKANGASGRGPSGSPSPAPARGSRPAFRLARAAARDRAAATR